MVADALAGKIDLIVTKSVSRFARNTVDSLTTIRQLKENGIECYFEKENIWTFDGKGELLLTIMSSLAQEESRSISENCTWGQRKRFADGKVTVPFNRFLGYDRGPDGNLVVNREQAAIVQRIYAMFLQGMTYNGIAQQLTDDGILSPGGKPKWNTSAVKSILSNEKYKGCALLQKTYTVDYLTKKKKVNEGEIPQYYVEDNHEAIIDPDTFEMVQREMEKRGKGRKYHSGVHTFSSKIRCGECGSWYGSKVWHSNSKYRKVIGYGNVNLMGGIAIPNRNGIALAGDGLAGQIGSLGLFFLGNALHIGDHLPDERVLIQLFGVNYLTINDTTLFQGLSDSNRVNIIKAILFFFREKPILLDKLGNPALYLCPRQIRGSGRNRKSRKIIAILLLQPCRRTLIAGMIFHITDNGLLAPDVTIPFLECCINSGLGIHGPHWFRGRFCRLRLGHRKSGGLSALRLLDILDLLLLRQEQV